MQPLIKPTLKQHQAWEILRDDHTTVLAFGGGSGGGKSWLGCEWLMTNCFFYPGTKWFMGRNELKRLRESTLETWHKMLKHHKINPDALYSYNGQDHVFKFHNGSRIDCLELRYLPSDPLYERFGSLEFTGGWIEEGGEVHAGAIDTLKTRIGRTLNTKYKLHSKLLITCNPKKNWLYTDFYKPFKSGTLPNDHAFIQSLVNDNQYNETEYIHNLENIKDKGRKERLLYGNWEYDDDPASLMDYDSITDLFTNSHVGKGSRGAKYVTVDVARLGKDKTVIRLWHGWTVVRTVVMKKKRTNEVADRIKELAKQYDIPRSHIAIDEDGIGGGVVDQLPGCKGFVNNSRPIEVKDDTANYGNLKAQCTFMFCEYVTEKKIWVICHDQDERNETIEELEQIKEKDIDKDGKKYVIPKEKLIQVLGRSPDYFDSLMIRMYFVLKPSGVIDVDVS